MSSMTHHNLHRIKKAKVEKHGKEDDSHDSSPERTTKKESKAKTRSTVELADKVKS